MRRYELTERGKILLAVLLVLILLVVPAAVIAITSAAGQTPEPDEPTASLPVSESPTPGVNTSPTPPQTDTPTPAQTETPAEPEGENTPEQVETPDNTPEQTEPPEQTAEPTPDDKPEPPEQSAEPIPDDKPEPPEQTAEPTPDDKPEPTPEQTEEPPGQSGTKPSGTNSNSSSLDGGKLSFIFDPKSRQKLDEQTERHIDAFLKIPDYIPDYKIIVETPEISQYDQQTLMRTLTVALAKRGLKANMLEHESTTSGVMGATFDVRLHFVSTKVK